MINITNLIDDCLYVCFKSLSIKDLLKIPIVSKQFKFIFYLIIKNYKFLNLDSMMDNWLKSKILGKNIFGKMTVLEELKINSYFEKSSDVPNLTLSLKNKTNLKHVNLMWNNLDHSGLFLLCISLLKNPIESLDISCNNLLCNFYRGEEITVTEVYFSRLIDIISKMKNLEYLNLSFNYLRNGGSFILSKSLPKFTNLKCLILKSTLIGNLGIKILFNSLHNYESLELLDLSNNNINNRNFVQLISIISTNKINLKYIDLSSNLINTRGLLILEWLNSYNSLFSLNLDFNYINNYGILLIKNLLEQNQYLKINYENQLTY